MDLKYARVRFTAHLNLLLMEMLDAGYHPALNEGMDRLTERDRTSDHMKGSLHDIGLAQDIDLYDMNYTYLSKTEDHRIFGEYWESLDSHCNWGGRFGDGNHYSFSGVDVPGCITANGDLRK